MIFMCMRLKTGIKAILAEYTLTLLI